MSTNVALPPLPLAELGAWEPALRQEVRDFLARTPYQRTVDPMVVGFDPDFSAALGAAGYIGMTVPTEHGGPGRSPLERYVVIEELLAAGAPVGAHWASDRQVAPSLVAHGTEFLRQRYLPPIVAGKCFIAIGLSEPDAGSDLAGLRTRAKRTSQGWSITGTKVWTSGAHFADSMVVLARTGEVPKGGDRRTGLSQFIVDLPHPNVTIRPIRMLTGDHHFNEVVFAGAVVPEEQLLGDEGLGWQQATAELAYERCGPDRLLSTMALVPHLQGAARGRALARLWALRQASAAVNSAIARGVPPEVQAVMVKDLGTQYENEVLELALAQTDAEPDLSSDDPLARVLAEAMVQAPTFTLRGGTTEILRGIVARGLGVR